MLFNVFPVQRNPLKVIESALGETIAGLTLFLNVIIVWGTLLRYAQKQRYLSYVMLGTIETVLL